MGKYFDYEHICGNAANTHIAHGALTNSKRPSQFVEGVYPLFFVKGKGAFVYDFHGDKYLDYLGALGTNYFGYSNNDVNEAISKELLNGSLLSLGTPTEVYFAMKFKDKFSHVDRIRILKSGSEGCTAAIRIARAYNYNREFILTEGYHGWHDRFVALTPPSNGVPVTTDCHEIKNWRYFDFDSLNSQKFAAVILEPVVLEVSTERRVFLERLREACTRSGTALIFDETITAYRFPRNSVAGYWGIEPDLCVQGKALANGMPISVVGGKKEFMDYDYFVSSTFAGETLTLAAAIKCIDLISNEYNVDQLWEYGTEFIERFSEAVEPIGLKVVGYPTRGGFRGGGEMAAIFFQEMLNVGVFFHPQTWFYSHHLHKHINSVIDVASKISRRILDGYYTLQGSLPNNSNVRKN